MAGDMLPSVICGNRGGRCVTVCGDEGDGCRVWVCGGMICVGVVFGGATTRECGEGVASG